MMSLLAALASRAERLVAFAALTPLACAQEWVPLTLPQMWNCAMSHDVGRGRTVLVGAQMDPPGLLTWEHDGSSWRRIDAGPLPFYSDCLLAWDWSIGNAFLYATLAGDLWELTGGRWTQRARGPVPPPKRVGAAMVYDVANSSLVLFGGLGTNGVRNDTWVFRGNAWQQLTTANTPSARMRPALTYDLTLFRTLLFGGETSPFGSPVNDTWSFDGINWVQLTPVQSPPTSFDNLLTHDSARGRTLLISSSQPSTSQQWEFDGVNWSLSAAPPPVGATAMVHQTGLGRTILVTSHSLGSGQSPETWFHDGTNWAIQNWPATDTVSYDGDRDRVVAVTIENGTAWVTWELADRAWHLVATAHTPPAMNLTALCYDQHRQRTLSFGGVILNPPHLYGETWQYDGTDWQLVVTPHSPPPRQNARLGYDPVRHRVVLFGGDPFALAPFTDTWEFDGSDWSQVATPTAPLVWPKSLLYDHARERMVMLGDYGGCASLWSYDGADWTNHFVVRLPSGAYAGGAYARQLLHDPLRGALWLEDTRGALWNCATNPPALIAGQPTSQTSRGTAWFDPRQRAILTTHGSLLSLLRLPDVASSTRYGSGCAGSHGVPSLDTAPGAAPALGTSIGLKLTALPTTPGLALLTLGTEFVQWNGALLPQSLDAAGLPGCDLWLAPAQSLLLQHGGNAMQTALRIPLVPSLAGVELGMQAFAFDAAAANGLGAVSNGLVLRLH